jgi:hypothetical protein
MSANRIVTCFRSPSRRWRASRIFSVRYAGVYDKGARCGAVAGEKAAGDVAADALSMPPVQTRTLPSSSAASC